MAKYLLALVWPWYVLFALCSGQADAYIANDRWFRTATNISTGSLGTPITLTWSFAPDNTLISGNTTGTTVPSNLLNFLDTNLGVGPGGSDLTERPWFPIFEQSFNRLSALSGVTYIYEPNDDARAFSDTNNARGVLDTRGDIRLGGKSYGSGSNILASNYFPDFGEMMINTDQVTRFTNSTNNSRLFRNTLMHEVMHGIGISHVESSNAAFLIEPILSTGFDGPQLDDLLAMQRLYGDVYEKNGGNDVVGNATFLGTLSPTNPIQIGTLGNSTAIAASQIDFLSIDDDSDTDFFSFSLTERLHVSLDLTPRGATYMVGPQGGTQSPLNTLTLSDLSLALFDINGTTLLDLANANSAGGAEQIQRQLLPGTYFARVKGAQNDIQLYGLGVSASLPVPTQLVWVGNFGSTWDTGITPNFSAGSGMATFLEDDHVRFDDSSSVKTVFLNGELAAGDILISTAGTYFFTGSGSIVAGNLTIDGGGFVVLANSGNSYSGETRVLAGTLIILGDTNAMHSPITIASGATLTMDATDAASMTSSFTIEAGGTLQIGTATSTTNVFPDAPTGVFNSGTIRVLASETLSAVAGGGQIEVVQGTTTLLANPAFAGNLTVQSGAVAKVDDGAGLGSAATSVLVESGGLLRLAEGGMFSQSFEVAAEATIELLGADPLSDSARLSGLGQVDGALTMPGTIAPGSSTTLAGSLSFTDDLTLVESSHLEFQLGGATAGVDFASLLVTGEALLAGTLDVALTNQFMPTADSSFELLSAAAGVIGVFDALLLPALESNLEWSIVYNDFSVRLLIASTIIFLPGDFNFDGTVDAADYTVWRDGLDITYTLDDFNLWRDHFGQSAGSSVLGASSAGAVPEPAMLVLVSAIALAFSGHRSRR